MKNLLVLMMILSITIIGCERRSAQEPGQVTKAIEKAVPSLEQTKEEVRQDIEVQKDAVEIKPARIDPYKPFYVYATKTFKGNHFVPSGFMPNGKCINFTDEWGQNCHRGKTCIKVVYDIECSRADEKWAGVYWLNPANNWGSRKGGFDLTGAKRLTFWARGEKGGEQVQEFTMGGITGDYPDSDTAMIGPVILSPQWRKYTIDLRGKNLTYISGGFAWTTSEEVNPEDCTFYLDDIRYE